MQINSPSPTRLEPRPSDGPALSSSGIIAFVSPVFCICFSRFTRFVTYHLAGFVAHHLDAGGFVIYRRRGVNGGNKAIVAGQPACGGRHN